VSAQLTIRLPFFCEPIVDEHRFGLVDNVFVEGSKIIEAVKVDASLVAHIGLHQSWATEIGAQENQERMRDMIKQRRLTSITLEQYEAQDKTRNDPYVSLTITLPEPHPREVTWYWSGDGTYDSFAASGGPDNRPETPEA
jgi:hypothetical protein